MFVREKCVLFFEKSEVIFTKWCFIFVLFFDKSGWDHWILSTGKTWRKRRTSINVLFLTSKSFPVSFLLKKRTLLLHSKSYCKGFQEISVQQINKGSMCRVYESTVVTSPVRLWTPYTYSMSVSNRLPSNVSRTCGADNLTFHIQCVLKIFQYAIHFSRQMHHNRLWRKHFLNSDGNDNSKE